MLQQLSLIQFIRPQYLTEEIKKLLRLYPGTKVEYAGGKWEAIKIAVYDWEGKPGCIWQLIGGKPSDYGFARPTPPKGYPKFDEQGLRIVYSFFPYNKPNDEEHPIYQAERFNQDVR